MLQHSGRDLHLLPQLGSAEMVARFMSYPKGLLAKCRKEELSYTLRVSTYQMCVLLMFNNRDEVTFQVSFAKPVFFELLELLKEWIWYR